VLIRIVRAVRNGNPARRCWESRRIVPVTAADGSRRVIAISIRGSLGEAVTCVVARSCEMELACASTFDRSLGVVVSFNPEPRRRPASVGCGTHRPREGEERALCSGFGLRVRFGVAEELPLDKSCSSSAVQQDNDPRYGAQPAFQSHRPWTEKAWKLLELWKPAASLVGASDRLAEAEYQHSAGRSVPASASERPVGRPRTSG
jgi:hypothetical protein